MKKRVLINIMFAVYILILFRITVFRSGFAGNTPFSGNINLIPLADLLLTLKHKPSSFIYLFSEI